MSLAALLQSVPVASAAAAPSAGGWFSNAMSGLGNAFKGSDWASMLGAGLAGYAESKADQEIQKQKYATNAKELALERANSREVLAAQMERDYFQNRMNRDRKRQGVNGFRQFRSNYAYDSVKNPGA